MKSIALVFVVFAFTLSADAANAQTFQDSIDNAVRTTPLQQQVYVERDDDGMPGWLKTVLIVGGIALGGYIIYQCVKEGGFCHNDVNVSQMVDLTGNGGPGITVTQR